MSLEAYAYTLPLWACIVVALAPPLATAIIVRWMRRGPRPPWDEATKRRQTLLVQATIFIYGFLLPSAIGTVWSEDQEIYAAANTVAQDALAVVEIAKFADPDSAEGADEAMNNLLTALPRDIDTLTLRASSESQAAISAFLRWSDSLDLGTRDREIVDALASDTYQAWRAWLVALNAPGLPDVTWVLIFALGCLLVGVISAEPVPAHSRGPTLVILAYAAIIGCTQLPLWILNSESFVRNAAGTVFEEFAPSEGDPLVRLVTSIVIIGGLAGVTYVVLRFVTAKGHRTQDRRTESADV